MYANKKEEERSSNEVFGMTHLKNVQMWPLNK
jgi:hypothetical protein